MVCVPIPILKLKICLIQLLLPGKSLTTIENTLKFLFQLSSCRTKVNMDISHFGRINKDDVPVFLALCKDLLTFSQMKKTSH